MAGVGNQIHPRESFQPFSIEEYSYSTQGTGGGGMSRMRKSDLDALRVRTQENLTLDDVRWSDMRKKVPLMGRIPTSKMNDKEEQENFEKQKKEHVAYIRQHFKQIECQRFVPDPKQKPKPETMEMVKCHCGEVIKKHVPYKITPVNKPYYGSLIPLELEDDINLNSLSKKVDEKIYSKANWTPAEAFRPEKFTTSFGKVKFSGMEQVGGMKPAKYLRFKYEENPDVVTEVIHLLKEHWKIMQPRTPSLIISVVGGAKNFKLSGRMRETFQSGLIKASQTTNAWLITSGFNMGVMKEVGLAVREGQSFEWYKDRFAHVLRCIGIAPWGYVKDRHVLSDYSQNVQGKFDKIAEYKTSNIIEHLKPVPLNSDHTHFLFVDDGYRNKYGGVAKFRARFEKRLSDPVEKGGLGIPVVLIVVEGGRDAIEDAKTSLEHNIPVILCEGTGRAADILVYAYNNPTREKKLKKLINKAYFDTKSTDEDVIKKAEEDTDKVYTHVQTCMGKKDLISIFHINKHEELDNEILKILLKAKKGEVTEQQRLERLKLALKWDRADIAQEEIFREDALWAKGSFDECLKEAILNDNVKFVQIILNQGVVMRDYLTLTRLMKFYQEAIDTGDANSFPIRKVMERMKINVINQESLVAIMIRLMDKFEYNFGEVNEVVNEYEKEGESSHGEEKFKYPYKQLLVWSVLLLRQNVANFALKMGGEPITSTVAASRIYYSMGGYIHSNELALKNRVLSYKVEFDELATDVLDECHQRDPNKAMMLAERKSPTWSNMTSMQMAASADNLSFLSSVGCRNSINTIWKRGITSSRLMVFFIALFPFMAFTPCLEVGKLGDKEIRGYQKFLTFVTSPIAKFTYNSIMYVTFLMLFTYFVLVEFRIANTTPIEIICVFWIFTFIIDNLYTCLAFPSPTLKGTIRDWFGMLKIMDLANCVLALLAFFLHYDGQHYRHAKAIFCINAVVFCIRIMDIYTVNSRLGPKMVMIKRMMLELVTFILVLTVFLVAYGIVSQGLLYLQRERDWVILRDIIYYPYWQFYGELFLDEVDNDDNCASIVALSANSSTDMTSNLTAAEIADKLTYCRTFHWLVPVFLAVYLLIGNVLLLNLLIAIFSNVFHEIEINSNRIWNYQMYMLVMEFDTKAALVPPLSIIIHVYLIIKWIFRKSCCKKNKGRQFGSRHLEYLQLFEKEQLSNYLRKKKAEAKSATDISLLSMQKRIDELYKVIKEELDEEQVQEREQAREEDTLKRPGTTDSNLITVQSAKELATTDKDDEEKERKDKKKKKKKKKKKEKEKEKEMDEDKILNIDDKESQKPELDKVMPEISQRISSLSDLPPMRTHSTRTPSSRRKTSFRSDLIGYASDSDSDDSNPVQPVSLNIRHDSENSDLNNFSKPKKKKDRRRYQDSFSEEDQYRGSRIRQKLRKKRSSTRKSDSDSM